MADDGARIVAPGAARSDARDRAGNCVARMHVQRVRQLSHSLNYLCAALLMLTGGLGVFWAFGDMKTAVQTMLLSVYSLGFGFLILRYEISSGANAEEFRARYGFMFSLLGQAVFLLLSGNLTWMISPMGWVTAVLVNASAIFLGYVYYSHPEARMTLVSSVDQSSGFSDISTIAAREQHR